VADPVTSEPCAAEGRAIRRDGLAIGMATGLYGVSFGAVSVSAGLSVLQTCALSLVMFTGASQFAFVGVAAAGGAPLSGVATALMLGTRNTLYGVKLAPLLQFRGWRRLAAAHVVIDESTAMSVMRTSRAAARVGFVTTGLAVFALWNLFTLLGALAGNLIGDPRTYGLDAAVGGAFLALLWPRLADGRNRVIAACAAVVALGAVPLTAAGVPVLVAGGVALLAGVLPPSPVGPTQVGER
jgi:predicted branched-subunit amino acid permease